MILYISRKCNFKSALCCSNMHLLKCLVLFICCDYCYGILILYRLCLNSTVMYMKISVHTEKNKIIKLYYDD